MGNCQGCKGVSRPQNASDCGRSGRTKTDRKLRSSSGSVDRTRTDRKRRYSGYSQRYCQSDDECSHSVPVGRSAKDVDNPEKLLLEKSQGDRRRQICPDCVVNFPNNCIGSLVARDRSEIPTVGTAFMISPVLALTSAHVCYFIDDRTEEIRFFRPKMIYLGMVGKCFINMQNNILPLNHLKVKDWKICPAYVKNLEEKHKIQKELTQRFSELNKQEVLAKRARLRKLNREISSNDYAILTISHKLQLSRYLKLTVLSKEQAQQVKQVKVQGYQTRTNQERANQLVFKQYYHVDNVNEVEEGTMSYYVDTVKSQSGSPVLCLSGKGQYNEVIGIHRGYKTPPGDCNSGTRVTYEMLQMIETWCRLKKIPTLREVPVQARASNMYAQKLAERVEELEEQLKKINNQLASVKSVVRQTSLNLTHQFSQARKSMIEAGDLRSLQSERGGEPFIRRKEGQLKVQWDTSQNSGGFQVNGDSIIFKQGQNRRQIVSDIPFKQKSVFLCTMQLTHYGGSSYIAFGIINQDRKYQVLSGEHKGSIGLLSYPQFQVGVVKVNNKIVGSGFDKNKFVAEKKTIKIQVDLIHNEFMFIVEGGFEMRQQLPQNFIGPPLYLFITMSEPKDEVKLIHGF